MVDSWLGLNADQGAGDRTVSLLVSVGDAGLDVGFFAAIAATFNCFFLLPLISLASFGWLFLKRLCRKTNVFAGVSGLDTRVKPL